MKKTAQISKVCTKMSFLISYLFEAPYVTAFGLLLPFLLLMMLFAHSASRLAPWPTPGFCLMLTFVRSFLIILFKIAPLLLLSISLPYLIFIFIISSHYTFSKLSVLSPYPRLQEKIIYPMFFTIILLVLGRVPDGI